jgi:hypothetical protein
MAASNGEEEEEEDEVEGFRGELIYKPLALIGLVAVRLVRSEWQW